ncbi:Uncharacterised protein [uncultured archaeon]|nr:Uncharacterised protein [uncultured archaeon]
MQKQKFKDEMDTLDIVENRLEIMVGARVRDKDRMMHALEVQDRLRGKSVGWKGADEIRRWRNLRK